MITHVAPRPGARIAGPGKFLVLIRLTAEALAFEEEVSPDAPPVPLHVHMRQAERFTVLEGVLRLEAPGGTRRLGPGETALVAPGMLHTYASDGEETLRIEVELTPPERAWRFFESVHGLGRDGRLPPRGPRDALALAALSHRHGFYLAGLPLGPQRALMSLGASLAVLLGVDPWRPAYAATHPLPDPQPRGGQR